VVLVRVRVSLRRMRVTSLMCRVHLSFFVCL
jgi:hypothetical protein